MNGLIVAGGNINDKFACDVIKNGAFEVIFAADSGIDFMYRNHITPDIIVGDFDSANPEILSFYRDMDQVAISELNPEKDDTDLEHALRDCVRLGCDEITILGCFGNRIDHSYANMMLLGIGLEYGVEIRLMDDKNRVSMHCSDFVLKKNDLYGKYVSLLPINGTVHNLTITGMKYCLENTDLLPFTTLGVSNELVEDQAQITFEDGILLLIESKDE
ncbi:thiamine diphosphokinase [Agathobacter ruminis]|uniref:Thiamine diphosphokinase n=1 Tax=Agathobacter ruminis TaxID=1712665 RepID=A0A2G3E113_9FIRM|nr:thiamine diphosphokinase [Agathobacter ruminis]MDC7300472.1 thiamine diphosphokinase [Agathobacter ruminis]PHU36958.1 thiamine diphosphokinase [Agathobacter ruminis]